MMMDDGWMKNDEGWWFEAVEGFCLQGWWLRLSGGSWLNDEGWRMNKLNDEGWMKNDEGWWFEAV